MRKKLAIGLLGTIFILSACANVGTNDELTTSSAQDRTQEEVVETTEVANQDTISHSAHQGTYESCLIQEDEQYLYFCGNCRVSKIDKTTGEEIILWENADEAVLKDEYLYSRGTGLLIDDRIYFIEAWHDAEGNLRRAVACICTDGSGYERFAEVSYSSFDCMYLQDGMLYVDDLDSEIWFQVQADGTLSEPEIHNRGYQEKLYYTDNGEHMLFEQQSLEEFGSYLKQTNDGYVMSVKPDTEEKEYLSELVFFSGYNSKYFLVSTYSDGMTLSVVERANGEERSLYTHEENFDIVGMDEEYVYIKTDVYEGENTNYSYERIRLEDGEKEQLFVRYPSLLMMYDSDILMDVVVWNGYLYYMDVQDYNFYRMRRAVDAPEEAEIVGEAVYATGIGDVGTIEMHREKMYSERDTEQVLYNLNLTWLVVDDKFPGANLINSYLIAEQESNMSYAREQYGYMLEDMWDCGTSELHSSFSGFSYVDNHYISFVQETYEYQAGAAHGMPYWTGHTFDLESGERMLLGDMVYNSEEELKEIVSRYFEELIHSQPEGSYWDDAAQTVYDSVTYESDCFLTEEGIVFYYGPYELACYAAGFQEVTVPYEELDMRIILENAK